MLYAAYHRRSRVWFKHAVCSCHVPHSFTAHACAPARRVLMPHPSTIALPLMRVSQPVVCSCHIMPHASDHRCSCGWSNTLRARATCLAPLPLMCVLRHAVCSCVWSGLPRARATCPVPSTLRRCTRMPCAHAVCIVSSPLKYVLRHAVCRRHVLPSSLQRSCAWPGLPCAHGTCLIPSSLMRVFQRAVCSRHVHHVFAARACAPSCRAHTLLAHAAWHEHTAGRITQ